MISRTWSACLDGAQGQAVKIEASKVAEVKAGIHITGLPGDIIRESRERVKACLRNYGLNTPSGTLVVNLSPAATKKQGSQFDLAIALALGAAEGFFPASPLKNHGFLGEISLNGELLPILHTLPLLECLLQNPEIEKVIVPSVNIKEWGALGSSRVVPCEDLAQVLHYLSTGEMPDFPPNQPSPPETATKSIDTLLGHPLAKRALTLSLAGGHHLLLAGPPGSGKTLLAECVPSLLPPLSIAQQLEVLRIYSLAGIFRLETSRAPFRSPHHSISTSAFLGGGSGKVVPGEVSLSHHGILFLDELPEFRRDCLEGLRQPLQSGDIHLHRVTKALTLPAQFLLIAAMNPCPCGFQGSRYRACRCSQDSLSRYRKRVSGPILDRFDLYVWMDSMPWSELKPSSPSEAEIKQALAIAKKTEPSTLESLLGGLKGESRRWAETKLLKMSHRGLFKVLKVAETIARLAQRDEIQVGDLCEAWTFRPPETLK